MGKRAMIAAVRKAVSKVDQKLLMNPLKQLSQTGKRCFAEENVKEVHIPQVKCLPPITKYSLKM
jgi:DNA-binding FrmR family transcriptional regulator